MAKFDAGYFGACFSLYPMTDRYVPVILGAIEGIASSDSQPAREQDAEREQRDRRPQQAESGLR